jgi:hypothetical protein
VKSAGLPESVTRFLDTPEGLSEALKTAAEIQELEEQALAASISSEANPFVKLRKDLRKKAGIEDTPASRVPELNNDRLYELCVKQAAESPELLQAVKDAHFAQATTLLQQVAGE